MKSAVKLALAYCYATGELPSGLHLATWSAAHELCTFIDDLNERLKDGRSYCLSEEALVAIAEHPLKLATDWLRARGFKADQQRRRTSHYVNFAHPRQPELEATAYRSGGANVTIRHDGVPFVTVLKLEEAEPVWPAILRPAFYAGERGADETGRAYYGRAMAAYRKESINA